MLIFMVVIILQKGCEICVPLAVKGLKQPLD